MKALSIVFLAVCLSLAAGCGDKNAASKNSGTANRTGVSESTSTPLEQSLALWKQGDHEGAVQRFLEIDWKSGPALTPGTALALAEKEFAAKPAQEREDLAEKFMAQINDLKALARAVRDKGQAVAATDKEYARRCFNKLAECGSVLDKPGGLKILQMAAQAIRKLGSSGTGAPER